MNLEYILTEDNTMVGIKGFCTDYSGYKNIPYQNRCLFMKISPDHHFKYQAEAMLERQKKQEFLFENDEELVHYLKHSGCDDDTREFIENWMASEDDPPDIHIEGGGLYQKITKLLFNEYE